MKHVLIPYTLVLISLSNMIAKLWNYCNTDNITGHWKPDRSTLSPNENTDGILRDRQVKSPFSSGLGFKRRKEGERIYPKESATFLSFRHGDDPIQPDFSKTFNKEAGHERGLLRRSHGQDRRGRQSPPSAHGIKRLNPPEPFFHRFEDRNQ